MKFAMVNGQRQEAQPGSSGACPGCGKPVAARCGEVRVWHWAHQGKRDCDQWWEGETAWHRAWKDQFPTNWQEVMHHDESGERHIADVKTDHGWVIELQYSYLEPRERRARNEFYRKIAWVVNGTRRKRDAEQFREALRSGMPLNGYQDIRRVRPDGCSLLRDWGDTTAPVFFDFGNGPTLWWMFGRGRDGHAYVAPFSRAEFVEVHRHGATSMADEFNKLVSDIGELIAKYEVGLAARGVR